MDDEKHKPTTEEAIIDSASKPRRELSMHEREIQVFIESHKQPVTEVLTELIRNNRFVLVGESHLGECEPIRKSVADALPRLQQEGLTHVALEANSANQVIVDELNYDDPKIKEVLRAKRIVPVGWREGNLDILVTAKKLGLKVVLINYNDNRPDAERDDEWWQNYRELEMLKRISQNMDGESKMLIFIGNDHVHKSVIKNIQDKATLNGLGRIITFRDVAEYTMDIDMEGTGRVAPLGMRLTHRFGEENVSSIRYVPHLVPKDVLIPNHEVVIIPDQGPVKGDSRISRADYIITEV